MTWRLVWWGESGFPNWHDYPTRNEAHREQQRIERDDPAAEPSVHEIEESA